MKKNKKLQDEIAKACLMKNGAPLSISEHVDLVSKIKLEVAQTLSRTVEASEAMVNGMFWRLDILKIWIPQ